MNPRHSLRKIFGLYEHELNDWVENALRRVHRVIDVGANDGYFIFGCVAAFKRLRKTGSFVAFEPQPGHVQQLRASADVQNPGSEIEIVQAFAGGEVKPGMTTLDALTGSFGDTQSRERTLIKIDVEGAEMAVIAGGQSWLHPSNAFLIEVHDAAFLDPLKKIFAERGITVDQIDQRPLPVLGRELRDAQNWWLVSRLEA